jgi:hypothetical protein
LFFAGLSPLVNKAVQETRSDPNDKQVELMTPMTSRSN